MSKFTSFDYRFFGTFKVESPSRWHLVYYKEVFLFKFILSIIFLGTAGAAFASKCAGLPPEQMLRCFATEQNAQGTQNLSPQQRLSNKLGPQRTAGCSLVSARYVGMLLNAKPGTDEAGYKEFFMGSMRVFGGISRLQGESNVTPHMNAMRDQVKSASLESLQRYFNSNCDHDELQVLIRSGWK